MIQYKFYRLTDTIYNKILNGEQYAPWLTYQDAIINIYGTDKWYNGIGGRDISNLIIDDRKSDKLNMDNNTIHIDYQGNIYVVDNTGGIIRSGEDFYNYIQYIITTV